VRAVTGTHTRRLSRWGRGWEDEALGPDEVAAPGVLVDPLT